MLAHNALSTGSNIRICDLGAHLFCHLFFLNFPNNKQSHGNITIGWGFSLYHLSHNIAQTQTEKRENSHYYSFESVQYVFNVQLQLDELGMSSDRLYHELNCRLVC